MDEEVEVELIEVRDEEGSTTCALCHAICLDPEVDGVGSTIDGQPVCTDCGAHGN